MLGCMMIFFDASSYSKRTYARFRSNLALERFVSSPHSEGRSASLKWARAWLLVIQRPDRENLLAPLATSIGMYDDSLSLKSSQRSVAQEDVLD